MTNISKKGFFVSVFVIVVVYAALGWLFSAFFNFECTQITALVTAGILGTANIVISFIILTVSYNKDIKGFMVNYFGGMGIRLLLLLSVIFLVLKFMRIDIFVFILSLFVLYFVFQTLEIYYIHSYQKRK